MIEFRTAIRDALDEELERDETVVFFGEDVAKPGGVFAVTPDLQERHGVDRVFDTPISELVMSGAAFGAAVTGLRPVIEVMFGDFLPIAMDAIVNQASKYWYLSNEQAPVLLVVRSAVGAGGRFGAIHSQNPASWFPSACPASRSSAPSTPGDAKALLKAAIRDDNPVLFLEHKRLYSMKDEIEGEEVGQPIGQGRGRRPGRRPDDRLGHEVGARLASAAAETLAADGIDRRGHRPEDAAATRQRDDPRLAGERRIACSLSRRARARAAGAARSCRSPPSRACTTSTTPGGSRPRTTPSRTARRSRTRSCC